MVFLARAAAQALATHESEQVDAANRAREDLVAAARQAITDALGHDADADVLIEEDVDSGEHLVVFSDGAVYLAVVDAGTDAAQVWLVHHDDGWVREASVTSMADLGRALGARGELSLNMDGKIG